MGLLGVPSEPDAAAIRDHVAHILESPPFARSPRMCALLSFLVEETLAGRAAQLKEYTIATSVFGKPGDFDPGTSAVVRVEVGRLRRLLMQYQIEYGHEDVLQVQVPKGSYVPGFTLAPAPPDIRVAPKEPKAAVHPDGGHDWLSRERRLVTALSCALADRASQYSTSGELLTLVENLHERCGAIGLSHGGEVDASASDRLLIYFGWPNAVEDAPGRALTAALEIIAEAKTLFPDETLALRIGVATSEAITRPSAVRPRLQPAVMGEAPALATRMQTRAPPNVILVAESTRRLAGAAFNFLPAGELDLGGQASLMWRLLGARPVTTRFRSQHGGPRGEVIGRREERALLMSRWRLSLGGEGQAVLLFGEAGIGKSRLAESVLEQVRPGGMCLRVQCSPHHVNSALFPVIALLKGRFSVSHEWQNAGARAALVLRRVGLSNELNRALLTELINAEDAQRSGNLSASRRKELTLQLLTQIVLSIADIRPTVLLVEDVHWADPTSLELLQDLVEGAATRRLLVLMTSRPEGAPSFAQQTNVTAIRLMRLPREDCSAFIDTMTTATDLTSASRALILERAEGIPLFLEELTKLLLAVQPLEPGRPMVPESLNDLLAVQLDRLGPTRSMAQIASVVGRTFSPQMLASVTSHSDAEIESALDQLVAAGILIRDHGAAAETYTFRHALLRDAAYDSLLASTRRALHLRVGNTLIEYFPAVAADHPEVVAQHLLEGGRAGESIPFWTDAARIAASRYVLTEAIAHLRVALAALKSLSEGDHRERELALLIKLGLVIRSARGYSDAELEVIYQRAQALAETVGQRSRYLEAVYGLWTHAAGRGQWRRARELAQQFARSAQSIGNDNLLELESLRLLGACDAFMGNFASARDRHERAVALYDPAQHGPHFGFDAGAAVAAYLSWTLWHLGNAAAGRRYASKALAAAEAKNHPPTLAMVLAWLIFHAVCEEDFDAIDRYNTKLQAVCSERECRYWQPFGAACAEWAAFSRDGDARRVDRVVKLADAFEERYLTSCLLLLATRMCLTLDRQEEGLEIVERASAFIDEHDERIWQAEAIRLRVELLQRTPKADRAGAERSLRQALEIARNQGAAPFERKTKESLARLMASIPKTRASHKI